MTGQQQAGGAPQVAVRTQALTKVYPGDIRAVDGLDLEVASGELFGLLGPNGAGKSTTAGMLTGRVLPTSGRAEVAGHDVWHHTEVTKQLIGVVPQSNTLDRALTVRQNLYHHGRYFGMSARAARAAADDLLARFLLLERSDAPVLALSGGMAQRLMVARAMMHRPTVLFLDEPTTGLDPQSRLALWDIMRELRAAGQTIVLTTHYMEEADQLCDRIAIIDHGRLLALGRPEELKASVHADTIVDVVVGGDRGTAQRLADALRTTGLDDVTVPTSDVVRVAVSGRDGVVGAIVGVAEEQSVHLRDVTVTEASLESVFIQLTGRELRE